MRDAELRSSLQRYLESAIDQDKKLKVLLRAFAHKRGPLDPFYKYLCAHMEQLAAREVISEELLTTLQGPGEAEPPLSFPEPDALVTAARILDEFEEQLVRTYNEEPGKWLRKYRPASFGAANVDDIFRSGGEPKFAKKEGGIYHLISDGGRCYVVPEPGLKLQDSYFRSEGLGQLFECELLDPEAARGGVLLLSPAVVEESGERWIVAQKGELRERSSS